MSEFTGDTESQFLFLGYQRFVSLNFSAGLGTLVKAVPSMRRVFANPDAELRIPKNYRKLFNLLKHRSESDQMGRGYKIQWGMSRDVKPFMEADFPVGHIPVEIKLLFNLPTGETCGCVEHPQGQYTFFYKESVKKIYVHSEGLSAKEVHEEPKATPA